MSLYYEDSLYGNYRNRTFADIYPDEATFVANYNLAVTSDFTSYGITSTDAKFIYYLLYSKYGNSTIASSDENRFKFRVSSLMFQYGPLWKKQLDIQKELRALSTDDIQKGSYQLSNHAYNPSTGPSVGSDTELDKIDEQSSNRWKKSPLEGYANLMILLTRDATEEFLNKFKSLFLQVVEPELPLWYTTDEDQEDWL